MWRSVISCCVATMQTGRNAKNASACKLSNSRRTRRSSHTPLELGKGSNYGAGPSTRRSRHQTLSSDAEGPTAANTQAAKRWQRSAKPPVMRRWWWSGVLCVTALHTPPRRAHPLRDEEGSAPYRASHCHAANREIRICLNRKHPIASCHHLNSSFQDVFSNTGQPENVCFSNYETFLWLGLHP